MAAPVGSGVVRALASLSPRARIAIGTAALLLGFAAHRGHALVPAERWGSHGAPPALLFALAGGLIGGLVLAWSALGSAGSGPPEERGQRPVRVALAGLAVAALLTLAMASFDGSRFLWRSRYGLVACLSILALLSTRALVRPAAPEERRPARRVFTSALLIVLVAETLRDLALFRTLRYSPETSDHLQLLTSLGLNACLLAALLGILWALANRFRLAASALGTAVVALAAADAVKLTRLCEPVQPEDVFYLSELGSVWGDFVSPAVLCGIVALVLAAPLCVRFLASDPGACGTVGVRARWLALSLAVLAGLGFLVSVGPLPRKRVRWDERQASLEEGLLFHLWATALTGGVRPPPGYSPVAAEHLACATPGADGPLAPTEPGAAPDVVVLMVESLMEPSALGVAFTRDPLPVFHRLCAEHASGSVVSPAFGGKSVLAEFELLSGLTLRFLPPGSFPYRHCAHRDLPALPRVFRERGYRTVAVLADPPGYFGRRAAYPHLGFDEVLWLEERPDVARSVSGRAPADSAVMEEILRATADGVPTFVFAFTNATHAPYERELFGPAGVDLVAARTAELASELGGYASALERFDHALEFLVQGLRTGERPARLTVVGDHRPPLASAGALEDSGSPGALGLQASAERFSVPVLLWSEPAGGPRSLGCGMNFLGLEILRAAGQEPAGFQAVLQRVYERVPVLSHRVRSAGLELPWRATVDIEELLSDYRIAQHDLLFGDPPSPCWLQRTTGSP